MHTSRTTIGAASAVLLCGAAIAAATATDAGATPNDQPGGSAMQSTAGTSHADPDYDIASATTFVSINHSGAVILQATSGEEYTMQGCSAELTGSGARFSGCTGDGSVDFFGGKTPTSAVLSNVARDGQPHAGQLVLSTADGSSFTATISTVNFPLQGAGDGCVFHPDSTTSAFSCSGGEEVRG